ncbi:MAG: NINE protein [Aeromonas veronii]
MCQVVNANFIKSQRVALLLAAFCGGVGFHRLYTLKVLSGFLFFCFSFIFVTFPFALYDSFVIARGGGGGL